MFLQFLLIFLCIKRRKDYNIINFSPLALIFNNVANIKINSFLENLKKMRINRPLTAMVTDTNIEWTLNNLIYNLVEERKSLSSGKEFSHKK